MLKKYLLVILLVCGTICAGENGPLEQNNFNPKAGYKNDSFISTSFIKGNSLWTLKKDNIEYFYVNPVAFIRTKTFEIESLCLFVDIKNIDFKKIDTLAIQVTYLDKTTKNFRLNVSLCEGFFTISQKQIKQMFNPNVATVAFGVVANGKFISAVTDFNNKEIIGVFFKQVVEKFGGKRI